MTSNQPHPASNRTPSDQNGPDVSRLGSVAAVTPSVITSVLGHVALLAQVRIHWSLGLGPYYGPETAPTLAVWVTLAVLLGTQAALVAANL